MACLAGKPLLRLMVLHAMIGKQARLGAFKVSVLYARDRMLMLLTQNTLFYVRCGHNHHNRI